MLEYFVVFEKLVDLVGSAHFYKVLSSVVDSLLCFAPSCFAYILLPLLSYVVFSASSPLCLCETATSCGVASISKTCCLLLWNRSFALLLIALLTPSFLCFHLSSSLCLPLLVFERQLHLVE